MSTEGQKATFCVMYAAQPDRVTLSFLYTLCVNHLELL